ncbi:MAG: dihydropteroate synthase [Planctomycetota bacterium]
MAAEATMRELSDEEGRGAGGARRARARWELPLDRGPALVVGTRPLVVGILNCTPDSFSDGGRFASADDAVRAAEAMIRDGADWIDVGGESTRPGADPVPPEVQRERVLPVIRELRARTDVPISIDTRSPGVGAAALDAGADIVNDVSACADPEWRDVLRGRKAPVVLVHMQGTPRDMQLRPSYPVGAVPEVLAFFVERLRALEAWGVEPSRAIVDPGIGFGKRFQDNIDLIRNIDVCRTLGRPVMVGASRKSFLRRILESRGGAPSTEALDVGTVAASACAILRGADMVRVHNVPYAAVLVRVLEALRLGGAATSPAAEGAAAEAPGGGG